MPGGMAEDKEIRTLEGLPPNTLSKSAGMRLHRPVTVHCQGRRGLTAVRVPR